MDRTSRNDGVHRGLRWAHAAATASLLIWACLIPTGFLHGQHPTSGTVPQERLAPDRPGFSTGTHTVTPGRVYLEVGLSHSPQRGAAEVETQAPHVTIRTGLIPRVEAFVEWEGWTRSGDGRHQSTAPPALGTKLRVVDSGRLALTALGVVAREGSEGGTGTEATAGLMGEVEVGDRVGLFGGLQVTTTPVPEGRHGDRAGALGLEWEISSRWVGVVEAHSHRPHDTGTRRHGVEWGLLFFPRLWIQADVHIGLGSDEGQAPWFGAGVAVRR